MLWQKQAKLLVLSLVSIGALSACGPSQQSDFDQALSATLQPSDQHLAEIYNRSCKNCHTIAGTGAPLTGDANTWQSRMDKGMDTLLDNVINGFGGMPPFGMCMDCEPEQFEALIEFMASPGE